MDYEYCYEDTKLGEVSCDSLEQAIDLCHKTHGLFVFIRLWNDGRIVRWYKLVDGSEA